MYRDSPVPAVTKEHIISDKFSISCGFSLLVVPGGVIAASRGLTLTFCGVPPCDPWLERLDGWGVPIVGEAVAEARVLFFSARRRSIAAKSLRPASSSVMRPDILRSCSIRPRRFSRPSIYLALTSDQRVLGSFTVGAHPFGGLRFFST